MFKSEDSVVDLVGPRPGDGVHRHEGGLRTSFDEVEE